MYHAAMSHLAPIYAAWDGNAEAMASDIGQQGVTVRQWRNRGKIPQEYWRMIIDAAARRGASLTVEQFLPPPSDADQAEQAAA
jgi:hypothetical protein